MITYDRDTLRELLKLTGNVSKEEREVFKDVIKGVTPKHLVVEEFLGPT